jgi:hypothetical protein
MANELQQTVQATAETIAKYVEDVAGLTVITKYVQVGAGGDMVFDSAKPVARTIIKLDGDCEAIVPMATAAPDRVDTALYDLHERNVATATEYRARVLSALVGALQGLVQQR